ncbi:hypothetical protein BpHYR1_054613 [Brachionus plicatilis]|uniref:Uncharacterized protein n=1 Tax=Brachionus plicatilis TaxID=10195 RepID=A0A3M7QYU2_BRAPC|nr:hypothetical protein BpHYR1_054613 [Brachionus plicatilis]
MKDFKFLSSNFHKRIHLFEYQIYLSRALEHIPKIFILLNKLENLKCSREKLFGVEQSEIKENLMTDWKLYLSISTFL